MRPRFPLPHVLTAVAIGCLFCGCFDSPSERPKSNGQGNGVVAQIENPEGDTSVSSEDGGPGFTGESWTTAVPGPLGDPSAVKGGMLLTNIPNWPDNLRVYGIRANTSLNYLIRDLCYESLCAINPHTLDFIPNLASHWKISDDNMKFSFRINPKAHWSDGRPVTAADVVATYRLIMDETLLAPMDRESISKMKEPVAKSKYLIEVECKEKHWRNFIAFSDMTILPAHEIENITGKQYLDEYNFKYTAVSGPYIVHENDIKTEKSLTLTRRKDYWAKDDPLNQGLYNIGKIRFAVIRERRLGFDRACKGELDFSIVYTAKWWVEDLDDLEIIDKGHLIKQKVFTRYPQGFQGQALNMRHPPLDDVRVRKALAHLYDRKTMLDKFAYNEYEPLKSYFPGSDSENHDNKLVEFDPRQAAKLLAEAGWKQRGPDGILVKDGKRLSFELLYRSKFFEKYLTSFQQACKQAGVEFRLKFMTPETQWNNIQDRKFEIAGMNWGASLFPGPKTMHHSTMSDQKGSNNITGFKNKAADELIEQYGQEFDRNKRTELLRQLDAVIFNEHPYILDWYLPCERIVYLNKFGMPKTVLPKYGEWKDAFAFWWVDPSKQQQLKAARENGTSLPVPPLVIAPWSGPAGKTAAVD
jgi:microcin C transport system substrate-binding protein